MSVKKYGTKPLTNLWLLNIVKLVDECTEMDEISHENNMMDASEIDIF